VHPVRIEQLVKHRGASFDLGPLSLNLQEGEILGVMGPNGAGKTTLLKLLWGFLQPDAGVISVLGMTPHLQQTQLRRRAGFVSEAPQFYGWMTSRKFLAFVSEFYETWQWGRADDLLEIFGIDPTKKVEQLSKGTRAKLALIAAVSHYPSILILDELTSGLDPVVRRDILTFLRLLARQENVAIVLSSHVSDDLDQIADTALMLQGGRVLEYDKTAALTQRYGVLKLETIFLNAISQQASVHSRDRSKRLD
jgi:ABC-2 type transport system ATP-binding protein